MSMVRNSSQWVAVMCVLMIFSKAQALIARDEEITEKTKLKKMLQTKAELRKKGG